MTPTASRGSSLVQPKMNSSQISASHRSGLSSARTFGHLSPDWQPASNRLDRTGGRDGIFGSATDHHSHSAFRDTADLHAIHPSKDEYTAVDAARTGNSDLTTRNSDVTFYDRVGFSEISQGGDTALHKAAAMGDVEKLRALIGQGINVDSIDELDRTPLMSAILARNYTSAQVLLEHGASPSHRAQGVTPLLLAIQQDNLTFLDLLIKHGACLRTVSGTERGNVLHWASASSADAVAYLLDADPTLSIECRDGRLRTPLMIACDTGNRTIVQLLLDRGADIEAKSSKGSSPLAWASSRGHEDVVSLLLDRGADIHSVDEYGHSVLFLAANFGRTQVVELLLKRGAKTEVYSAPPEGLAPLHAAASEGHADIVKLLLQHGCDTEARTCRGQTALDIAVEDHRQEVLDVFLKMSAEDSSPTRELAVQIAMAPSAAAIESLVAVIATCYKLLKDSSGKSRFEWVQWVLDGNRTLRASVLGRLLVHSIETGDAEFLKWILAEKVDPNSLVDGGSRPLHLALRKNDMQIVRLLVEAGASPNESSVEGIFPLDEAVQLLEKDSENLEPLKLLLDSGGNTYHGALGNGVTTTVPGSYNITKLLVQSVQEVDNLRDTTGRTLLHISVQENLKEETELLLQGGANVEAADNTGSTPLLYGCSSEPMMRLLLDHGANVKCRSNEGITPMHRAAEADNVGGLILLADLGLDINVQDNDGRSPLLHALELSAEHAAMHLLTAGADVTVSPGQMTALHYACTFDSTIIASHLRSYNQVNLEATDETGITPLHVASSCGSAGCLQLLLDAGANVNALDVDGWDPLHHAAENGNLREAHMLLAAGADLEVRSLDDGLTARERADDEGFASLVALFDEWVATPHNYIPTTGAASVGLYQYEQPLVMGVPRTAWPITS